MKKRLLAILLAAVLMIGLLPMAALAAEGEGIADLPTPTNLEWGKEYTEDSEGNIISILRPGFISWQAPVNLDSSIYFDVHIYRQDGGGIISGRYSVHDGESDTGYYGGVLFSSNLTSMMKSDTYYFTVQAKTEGGESGAVVTSSPWTYTRPEATLSTPATPTWNGSTLTWDICEAPAGMVKYDLEFYFSKTAEGEPEYLDGIVEYPENSIGLPEDVKEGDPGYWDAYFGNTWLWTAHYGGAGYYYCKVRAQSQDITKYIHSEWSELSAPYHYTGETPVDPQPTAKALTKEMFTVDTAEVTYTGSPITKTITGKDGDKNLVPDTDYTVTYADNTNVGTAKITITGKGNYSGTVSYTFGITSDVTASIWLATHSITLVKGERACPVIRVSPTDAVITWESSDSSIASVDNTGNILGVKTGTAQITASITYAGKTVRESCAVTVTADTSVAMRKAVVVPMTQGTLWFLPFTYRPTGATITVSSSNPSVVTVGTPTHDAGHGTVALEAKSGGTATITVTATVDNEVKTATCTVTVPSSEREVAQKFVDIALAQKDKTGPQLNAVFGHTDFGNTNWCALFIRACSEKSGVDSLFPYETGAASFFIGAIEKGATGTSASTVSIAGTTKTDLKQFSPQAGDIIAFSSNGSRITHVGIVSSCDEKNIYVVHGSWHNSHPPIRVCWPECKSSPAIWPRSSLYAQGVYIIGYAHPNWSKLAPPVRGKVTFEYHCPIDVRYTYDGEVLDSATGQLAASFGIMELNETDDSIKVTLYDYYDVDIEITGNGEGTMDLTTTFEDEDGATSTRSFQNVPIDSDTVGKLYSTDSAATAYLELYKNEGEDFVEVWTAGKNETATEKDVELTDWYTNGNDFGSDEPTPTPPSGGGSSSRPSAPTNAPDTDPIQPEQSTLPFADVVEGAWYYDAVAYVTREELFNGTSATTFSPSNTMTRAMLMTVLARLDGQETSGGATWYAKAMDWAKEQGISDGSTPDGNVTREQLVTMLYRYAKPEKAEGGLDKFTDADSVSAWAKDAMEWAVANNIVTGKSGMRLDPKGTATRAEVATIIQRFAEKAEK